MTPSHESRNRANRLGLGIIERAGMLRRRGYASLHMQVWFPHVPLALLVALSGLSQFLSTSGSLRRLISRAGDGATIVSVASGLELPSIRGIPQEAVGSLLIIVGIGLLWRSRLAWVLACLLALATASLELSPLSTSSWWLVAVNIALVLCLLLFRRSFTRASLATGTLFALTGIVFTLGYGVLGSYVLGSGFRPKITNFVEAVYFTVVSMSTVGYGDITPQTNETRMFCVSLIVLGLVVFATSLTAIAGPVIERRLVNLLQPKRRRMKRTSHVIVTGDGPLARSTLKGLSARGVACTAIWSEQRVHETDAPEDWVIGDGSDIEVLRSANVEQARAVLALSEDDSHNAFVILAAKEINPAVRTAIAVGNPSNASRVLRAHADVVLNLPGIGADLLAMALSGEEIKADALISQLLKLG